jgi:hypothetical protein
MAKPFYHGVHTNGREDHCYGHIIIIIIIIAILFLLYYNNDIIILLLYIYYILPGWYRYTYGNTEYTIGIVPWYVLFATSICQNCEIGTSFELQLLTVFY